jgi:hypothetical protein
LKSEHLNFDRVSTGRQIYFVRARFIGSSDDALAALGGNYGCSGQGLAAEFHNARGVDARLTGG